LGVPRTATKSLWSTLGSHYEISPSQPKEVFNSKSNFLKFMNYFYIRPETKILLEGSPSSYNYHKEELIHVLKLFPEISNVKIIYPIRKPHDRLYSNVKQICVSRMFGNPCWSDFLRDDFSIDTDSLLHYTENYFLDSWHIEKAKEITNDILFFRFDEIQGYISRILNFIGVSDEKLNLRKMNSFSTVLETDTLKKTKMDLDRIFKIGSVYRKQMNKYFIKDLEITETMTGVNLNEWREEIENDCNT
jgi:hypothetical protein